MYIQSVTIIDCEFQPSIHARTRMNQRGISKLEALTAINKGIKQIKKQKVIAKYQRVTIVFRKKPCHIFIITTY